MSHFAYVMISYLVSAIVLLGLIIWILADQHIQKKELLRLEKLGVRRRSQRAQGSQKEK